MSFHAELNCNVLVPGELVKVHVNVTNRSNAVVAGFRAVLIWHLNLAGYERNYVVRFNPSSLANFVIVDFTFFLHVHSHNNTP